MDNIIVTAKELIKHCDGYEIEIEARIRKQLINEESSKLLIDNLGVEWKKTVYNEKRKISRSNRKCVYRQRNNNTICKSSLAKIDINNDWCALHVSVETPIPSMHGAFEGIEPASITRYRSEVDNHYIDVVYDKEQGHRVEVEVCDPSSFDPESTMRVVKHVCTVLQDSKYFVGYYDWLTVIHATKMMFCNKISIYSGDYQKPVTMTMRNLLDIKDNVHKWLVTPKADGNRVFIVIIDDRVFAVNTLKCVKLEGKTTSGNTISILDCEYIPSKNTYHVIDMIVNKEEYLGETVPVEDRLEIAQTCILAMCDDLQDRIKTKMYYSFDSFDALCKLYKRFKNDKTFDIDGMVFINTEKGYMQNVIKWKPVNTVDLMVKNDPDGHTVLVTYDDCEVVVSSINNIDMLQDESCSVWEFSYNIEEDTVTPIRPRPDKGKPNSTKVVRTNMFNAVSGSLFCGIGCYLMRKYHNRVKTDMIKKAHKNRAVILDIGTGQGGDVNKWKNARHVYCIEPSVSSTNEIFCRYKNINNLEIVNSYLRNLDPNTIKEKIDIFTAFFCMNQFEDADWDALIRLISNKGSQKCRLLMIAMTYPKSHNGECFSLTMKNINEYNISIHNTRILNINEKVVNPKKVEEMMGKCKLKLVERSLLNKDDFMTTEEKRLSSMFELFFYSR